MDGSTSSALRCLLRRVLRPDNGSPRPVPYRIDSIRQAALSKAFGEFNGILSSALTLRCTGNGPPSLKSSYPGRHPRQIQIVVMCLSSVARRPICIHARFCPHIHSRLRVIQKKIEAFSKHKTGAVGGVAYPPAPRLVAVFAAGRLPGFIDSRRVARYFGGLLQRKSDRLAVWIAVVRLTARECRHGQQSVRRGSS